MNNNQSIILTQSEYESLRKDIMVLKERVARLTALRDDLVYHICPSLQSEYEEKIASLERELLAAQLYLREMQRIIEILQAQMNQGQEPSMEEAEEQAQEEYQEYQEDLNRKAKEAEEFQDRWRKESNWYEYDEGYRNREEDFYEEDPENTEAGDGDHQKDSNDKTHKDGKDAGEASSERSGCNEDTDDSHDDDSVNAYDGDPESGHGRKQSKASELKSLYRKIVKLLHPDVHPNPTPKEKELLNRAIQAYDRGDLETMRQIWEELTGSGMADPEEEYEDSPEGIAKMREILEKLRKRCKELDTEIRHIKSEYPYTMKAFLDDEEAVEKRRSELQAEIDQTRETNRQLEEYINELKRQMGNR